MIRAISARDPIPASRYCPGVEPPGSRTLISERHRDILRESDVECQPEPGVGTLIGFPARNEERTVGDLVSRARVVENLPKPVTVVVVDDGSTDDTCLVAKEAGAEVLTLPIGESGLGAGVRLILEESLRRNVQVVAFMDADGEYHPEDLPSLAAPIIAGRVHYVVGNRFARGWPDGMPRWRAWGNVAGSLAVSVLGGTWVPDAQSGIRVLSRVAVERATIGHDYNYAQVLTIGLLRQDIEVLHLPARYRRRADGRSFVRLPTYLSKVVPAMVRARWGGGARPRI